MAFKQEVITGHRHQPLADRVVVEADLADNWASALVAAGLDPTHPTTWLGRGC